MSSQPRYWSDNLRKYTHAEWTAEARRLYGPDPAAWRFRCVSCGHVASVADWNARGDGRNAPYDCIGRAAEGAGGCNWTAGGMIVLDSCVEIQMPDESLVVAFPFADTEPVAPVPVGTAAS